MNEMEARAILGVGSDAGQDEVHKAHRDQAKVLHPDVLAHLAPAQQATAEAAMARLNLARDVLDEAARQERSVPRHAARSNAHGPQQGASPRPPRGSECHLCGWSPATSVTLGSVSTFLIWLSRKSETLPLCRACGTSTYHEAQSRNLTAGWWGVGILWMVPRLLSNQSAAARLRSLRVPISRDPSVLTPLDRPLTPSIPPSRRAGVWLASIGALLGGAWIVVGVVNTRTQPASPSSLMGTCWATDGSQLRQASCTDSTALYRVNQVTTDPNNCVALGIGSDVLYVQPSAGMYACMGLK
jgi:hypothetical protein